MKLIFLLGGLLCTVAFPLYAQNWTRQDSLRLRQLLDSEGEIKLNPEALKALGVEGVPEPPKLSAEKPWLDFDESIPSIPGWSGQTKPTLPRPYATSLPYNWDPIRQRSIRVDKNTWRGEPFYELTHQYIYSNWAKTPLDAGLRESLEQIEATGLRYRVTERANGMAVGSWQGTGSGVASGDFMRPFTRDFWNVKAARRRARTWEVLRTYGDSITVHEKGVVSK